MDSLKWSKTYPVLTLSRLVLRDLGFSSEGIQRLSDEDMQAIADTVRDNMLFAAGMSFEDEVRFVAACTIVEKVDSHE